MTSYIVLACFGVLVLCGTIYFAILQYLIEQNIRRMSENFAKLYQVALNQARSETFKAMVTPGKN